MILAPSESNCFRYPSGVADNDSFSERIGLLFRFIVTGGEQRQRKQRQKQYFQVPVHNWSFIFSFLFRLRIDRYGKLPDNFRFAVSVRFRAANVASYMPGSVKT